MDGERGDGKVEIMPRTWIEISREALQKNIRELTTILEPGVVFCAVVKAFAYGHGIAEVVTVCCEEGVTHFGVDSIDEAEAVRAVAGEQAVIFLLGMQMPEEYERVVRAHAIQTVSSPEDIRALAAAADRVGSAAQITFEIETGLHRLGAQERVARAMLPALREAKGRVFLQSVASHFASSEESSAQWETKRQNTTFYDAIHWLKSEGIHPVYTHIACSAATLTEPDMHYTMARIGIMLYGLWPSGDVRREGTLGKRHVQLTPALTWKTHVVHISDIAPGTAVGYGGTFVSNRPMRIAVLPVGYYDGMDRRAGSQGFVLVRGTKCPILGKICMNMCMIDIGGAPASTMVGDEVTLIGRDGIGVITADDLAQAWKTIHYEVTTRIAQHIPRMLV
jgi:alanine racemase